MRERKLTFEETVGMAPGFAIVERSRLYRVRRDLFEQLEQLRLRERSRFGTPKTAGRKVIPMALATNASMVLNGGIGRRLLNVREAAQYLGLEVDTIYRKARLREVPASAGAALRRGWLSVAVRSESAGALR
jgi:hypothetical protein